VNPELLSYILKLDLPNNIPRSEIDILYDAMESNFRKCVVRCIWGDIELREFNPFTMRDMQCFFEDNNIHLQGADVFEMQQLFKNVQ
jgi:hypothetical protein